MRFNRKSDLQKHLSKRHRPTFLHEARTEVHEPQNVSELAGSGEPAAPPPVERSQEASGPFVVKNTIFM
jgi:hypothetical protein